MSRHPQITALIYTDSDAADCLLRKIALHLLAHGSRIAGLVQHNQPRAGRSRCDMVLEVIGSGALVPISQDRGPHARGCVLDVSQLLSATQMVLAALPAGPDLVVLNKFGKTESEGGGFRPLIAEVVAAGLPLLIAVPWRNIESWRLFAGEMAAEIMIDGSAEQARALCLSIASQLDPSQRKPALDHAQFGSISCRS